MSGSFRFGLILLSVIGCGLMGGVFFGFSAFVMKALARLPVPHGIAAMQSINVAVINPWFLTPFLGTAAACVLLVISALRNCHKPGAGYILAGGLLYLLGTLLVTIACNVPRNNVLAAVEIGSVKSDALWAQYMTGWMAWNHVRAAAAVAAAALLTIALTRD